MLVGLIGGTGVDEMAGLASGRVVSVATRFGVADVVEGRLGDRDIVFVPRHGLGHSTPPSRVNYRAQVAALKRLGVERAVGVVAVGSLRPELRGGSLAVLGDFVDATRCRVGTFFDDPNGPVVHTDFTHPYCPEVSCTLAESCRDAGADYVENAIYVCAEGPRYETPAEVKLYGSWGADVVGMTQVPEAVLAREAGICYGAIAVVANLACGLSPTPLAHDEVRRAVVGVSDKLKTILRSALSAIPERRGCSCGANTALVVDG